MIFINGRFLTQRTTGVQRFALEVIKYLDKQTKMKFTILVPKNCTISYEFNNIKIQQIGKLSGHIWEQLELPIYTKRNILINLCNTAPMFKKNQIVVIHDAAVYASSQGFSFSFRVWYKTLFYFIKIFTRTILTISEFSKKELLEYINIDPKKVNIISEGKEHFDKIDENPEVLTKFNLEEGKYVLAVSSYNPNKNFKALVEATEYLNHKDFEIVIAGGTDLRVFNKNIIESENIKKLGYVTDEDLKGLYKNAGCFVFPSVYEGFGLPPLEAMSTGCPTLVSNVGPMPEVSGDAAIYFNPNDSKEIAEKINYVMKNDKLRSEMGVKGLEQSKKFSWELAAKQLIDAVASLDKKNFDI